MFNICPVMNVDARLVFVCVMWLVFVCVASNTHLSNVHEWRVIMANIDSFSRHRFSSIHVQHKCAKRRRYISCRARAKSNRIELYRIVSSLLGSKHSANQKRMKWNSYKQSRLLWIRTRIEWIRLCCKWDCSNIPIDTCAPFCVAIRKIQNCKCANSSRHRADDKWKACKLEIFAWMNWKS